MSYETVTLNVGIGGVAVAVDAILGSAYQRVKPGHGVEGIFTDVSLDNPMPVTDFYLEVQKGNVVGHTIMKAEGEREAIGITISGEDIWRGNQLTPLPTFDDFMPTPSIAGEQMSVTCENANDDETGTGARQITLHYLNADAVLKQEVLATLGGGTVDLVASDVRFIQNIHVTELGSLNTAAGHIKLHNTADSGLVYSMVSGGTNRSLVPHRMVPAGKTLYLREWWAEEAQSRRCAFRIRASFFEGVANPNIFVFDDTTYLKGSPSPVMTLTQAVPEFSIVKVSGWAIQNGAEGSCSWWGYLVDN